MNYLHTTLVLHHCGQPITAEKISNILKAIDIEPDEQKIKQLVATLESVDIKESLQNMTLPVHEQPIVDEVPIVESEEEIEEEKEEEMDLTDLFG